MVELGLTNQLQLQVFLLIVAVCLAVAGIVVESECTVL